MNIIKDTDHILLMYDSKRKWLLKVRQGENFATHKGIVYFDDIIGKQYGTCIFTKPQGFKMRVFKPLPSDFILKMGRTTQILYPEDCGLILMYTGIGPGSLVLEAGTGSGALTCILGNYVKPNGHIFSYGIREKSLKQAKKNIQKAKLENVVSIEYGDILKDVEHSDLDAVVLDLATPWLAIKRVKNFLKLSGTFASFSPTIEQVKKTVVALEGEEFYDINTFELIKRKIIVKENATRPTTRMIGHTGYLTFARRFQDIENPYQAKKPEKTEKVDLSDLSDIIKL